MTTIKNTVKMFIDCFAILVSIVCDAFYNTAVMDGAGAGALTATGFLGMGLLTGFETTACVAGAIGLPFVGGLVRALVYEETPTSDFFDKHWFKKTDPDFIEDITPFLMGVGEDSDDEIIDLNKHPFKMGNVQVDE